MNDRKPYIEFEHVHKAFGDKVVINDVSFDVMPGETVCILGRSGVGKSVSLQMIMGFLRADSGTVRVAYEDVTDFTEQQMEEVRKKVTMVFQNGALFDSLTVEENVAYRLIEETRTITDEIHARVLEALEFVELGHTYNLFPSELSGGMRRRVAIARAIITQPEILLYDSPTGGLDPVTSNTIIELVVKQRDVYKTGSLLVTHRLQDAFTMASHYFDRKLNKMVPLEDGSTRNVHTTFLILRERKIIFEGTASELLRCHDPYIREYLS